MRVLGGLVLIAAALTCLYFAYTFHSFWFVKFEFERAFGSGENSIFDDADDEISGYFGTKNFDLIMMILFTLGVVAFGYAGVRLLRKKKSTSQHLQTDSEDLDYEPVIHHDKRGGSSVSSWLLPLLALALTGFIVFALLQSAGDQKLLEKHLHDAKTLPSSDAEGNLEAYKYLLKRFPDNERYQQKVLHYSRKLALKNLNR